MTCLAPVLLGLELKISCSADPTSACKPWLSQIKDPQAAPVPANLGRAGKAAAGRVSTQCCEVLQVPGSIARNAGRSHGFWFCLSL